MTGKGRCLDNIYIERFWRSVKQEEFYLNDYADVKTLKKAISAYIEFYNNKRWHQSLDYKTPAQVYFAGKEEGEGGVETVQECNVTTHLAVNYINQIEEANSPKLF